MDVPLELAFHNLEASEAVEARVRERVAKLEKMFPRLVACRVVVEAPHKQHQKGNIFRVRIEMSVPGTIWWSARNQTTRMNGLPTLTSMPS